jgi:hypothetical protein
VGSATDSHSIGKTGYVIRLEEQLLLNLPEAVALKRRAPTLGQRIGMA